MGKISAWYDNERGFSNGTCDIAKTLQKSLNEKYYKRKEF